MNPANINCPHTAREMSRYFSELSDDMKARADALERGRVQSFSKAIDAYRSGKYAHALNHNGLSETSAINITSRTLNLPRSTVKMHLDRIKLTIQANRAQRQMTRAADMHQNGVSIRKIAAILKTPKSTIADWIKTADAATTSYRARRAQTKATPDPVQSKMSAGSCSHK